MEQLPSIPAADPDLPGTMELGAFSVSLGVADLERSGAFYAHLGFEVTGGDGETYMILKNGETTIGLFHGLFEGNILTFNPGLTNRMERIETFLDIRDIQRRLDDTDIPLDQRVPQESEAGPASLTLVDPDGNAILIDQFF